MWLLDPGLLGERAGFKEDSKSKDIPFRHSPGDPPDLIKIDSCTL